MDRLRARYLWPFGGLASSSHQNEKHFFSFQECVRQITCLCFFPFSFHIFLYHPLGMAISSTTDQLRSALPGEPDVDYPILGSVPATQFTCDNRHHGKCGWEGWRRRILIAKCIKKREGPGAMTRIHTHIRIRFMCIKTA